MITVTKSHNSTTEPGKARSGKYRDSVMLEYPNVTLSEYPDPRTCENPNPPRHGGAGAQGFKWGCPVSNRSISNGGARFQMAVPMGCTLMARSISNGGATGPKEGDVTMRDLDTTIINLRWILHNDAFLSKAERKQLEAMILRKEQKVKTRDRKGERS